MVDATCPICLTARQVRADTFSKTLGRCPACAMRAKAIRPALVISHPAYSRWTGMRARCITNDPHKKSSYKDRGIAVCAEWEDPRAFLQWADASGFSEELSLDRIDNNKGYSPENCRWTDKKQQARNTRGNVAVECDGRRFGTLAELAEHLGTSQDRVYKSLKNGWLCLGRRLTALGTLSTTVQSEDRP
jgi:hypothetical protein